MSARKDAGPSSRSAVTLRSPVTKRNHPNFAPPSARVVSSFSRPSFGSRTPSDPFRYSNSPFIVYDDRGGMAPCGIGPSAALAAFGFVQPQSNAPDDDAVDVPPAEEPQVARKRTTRSGASDRINTHTSARVRGS